MSEQAAVTVDLRCYRVWFTFDGEEGRQQRYWRALLCDAASADDAADQAVKLTKDPRFPNEPDITIHSVECLDRD